MIKNKTKLFALIIALLLISTVFSACSSGSGYTEKSNVAMENTEGSVAAADSLQLSESSVAQNRKIIETVYLDVQTKEFDALVEKIEDEVKKLGGYIEDSSVYGNELYDNDNGRSASYTVRVPAKESGSFTEFVYNSSTVTRKETKTEDVTLTYVDTESHIKALETEKATLEELLSKAESINDVIQIRDRLTSVIYEIESYKSQLRTYDNLIDYTTVHITVTEVERITVVKKQSIWSEIGGNLAVNFKNIWHGAKRMFVVIVSITPYLLLIGVITFIVLFIIKLSAKRRKAKRARRNSSVQNTVQNNTENGNNRQ